MCELSCGGGDGNFDLVNVCECVLVGIVYLCCCGDDEFGVGEGGRERVRFVRGVGIRR